MTEKEFEQLFKSNFQKMAAIAFRIVHDVDEARDIVQQTFVKLWDKRSELNITDFSEAYLHRAVVNTAINQLEKQRRLELKPDDTYGDAIDTEVSEINSEDIKIQIKNAIKSLPEKCGVIFSLSKFEGMSNQEIADYLNISIKAVEKQITKALKELRVSLRPYYKNILPLAMLFFWVQNIFQK